MAGPNEKKSKPQQPDESGPEIKDPPNDLPDYRDPPEPTRPQDPQPPVIHSRAAGMFDPNNLNNYIREPADMLYYIREPIPSEVPYRL